VNADLPISSPNKFLFSKHFGNTLRVAAGAAAGVASTDRLCHQQKSSSFLFGCQIYTDREYCWIKRFVSGWRATK